MISLAAALAEELRRDLHSGDMDDPEVALAEYEKNRPDPLGEVYDFGSAIASIGYSPVSLAAELLKPTGLLDERYTSVVTGDEYRTRPDNTELPGTQEWMMDQMGADPYSNASLLGYFIDPASNSATLGPFLAKALRKAGQQLPEQLQWMERWPRHEFEVPPSEQGENFRLRDWLARGRQVENYYGELGGVPEAYPSLRIKSEMIDDDPLPPLPSEVGEMQQYHGTTRINQFDEPELRINTNSFAFPSLRAGPHSAASPAIADTFAGIHTPVEISGIDEAGENAYRGTVFPIKTPGEAAYYPTKQQRYNDTDFQLKDIYRNLQADDNQVSRTLMEFAFKKEPDILAEFMQARLRTPPDRAKDLAQRAIRDPDSAIIPLHSDLDEGLKISLTELIDDLGQVSGDLGKQITDVGAQAMRDEGWHGIQYLNTAAPETKFSADKRSFITFDPLDIGYLSHEARNLKDGIRQQRSRAEQLRTHSMKR